MTTARIGGDEWKAPAPAALDTERVWRVYMYSVCQVSKRPVLDGSLMQLAGDLTDSGFCRISGGDSWRIEVGATPWLFVSGFFRRGSGGLN